MPRSLTFKSINELPPQWREQAREQLGMKTPKKRTVAAKEQKPLPPSRINEDGSILLVIPHPPISVSPNGRVGHMALYSAKKKVAQTAADAILEAFQQVKPPQWVKASVEYHWYHRKGSAPDADNLIARSKNVLDSIQNQGIVVNDSGVTMLSPQCHVDPDCPRLEVIIRGIKP